MTRHAWLAIAVSAFVSASPVVHCRTGAEAKGAELPELNRRLILRGVKPVIPVQSMSIPREVSFEGRIDTPWASSRWTFKPANCHSVYGNSVGTFFVCDGLSLQSSRYSFERYHRGGFWLDKAAGRAVPLLFEGWLNSARRTDRDFLDASSQGMYVELGNPPGFVDALEPDVLKTPSFAQIYSANDHVFGGGLPKDAKRKVDVPMPSPRLPGTSVIWGDLGPMGELRIKKVDGKTYRSPWLSGWATFVELPPGPHEFLVMDSARQVDSAAAADIQPDHTYVIGFDAMGQTRVTDLGVGVQCDQVTLSVGPRNNLPLPRLICRRE
jgi:hypothetical protein